MEESNPDLESFRQQWRAEVSARSKVEGKKGSKSAGYSKPSRNPPNPRFTPESIERASEGSNEHKDSPLAGPEDRSSNPQREVEDSKKKSGSREPRSALEHYEKAVERETQGSLGDSLDLYRKAFRLDNRVDQKYRSKHFPPGSFVPKPSNPNPSNASVTVPNTAHHSLDGHPQTIKQLIAGFSDLAIEPAAPEIEGTSAPPCPIADLPEEIVIQILTEVAIMDVAEFVRLAQVCKRMAYLVATEEQIWKRVCEGSEVGFGAMHYEWKRELLGGPLEEDFPELKDRENDVPETAQRPPLSNDLITQTLLNRTYASSWHQMFRSRPRIRFNGCYISTVNYIRPGQASASQVTWNSPVHIVTYYRYLRFFRDGTVISLLTTTEPTEVVHHITKELQEAHQDGGAPHLPSVVMQHALRGRWRLSSPNDNPEADLKDAEGDVYIETEGVSPKYMYRMEFSLRSAGKGAKNNKLVWKGFWNNNRLTDDWAEFTLRNDKAFFWSRVKSYGTGA